MQAEEKAIYVRIPSEEHTRLRIRVLENGTSIAEVVRSAIDDYLKSSAEGASGSNQCAPSTTPITVMNASTHSDYRRNRDE